MVKLTGYKKVKTAVFISGTGSNLKSLIKFSKKKKSPISIDLIISNNPKAKGLKLGKIKSEDDPDTYFILIQVLEIILQNELERSKFSLSRIRIGIFS